jgi:hypothetical protein
MRGATGMYCNKGKVLEESSSWANGATSKWHRQDARGMYSVTGERCKSMVVGERCKINGAGEGARETRW